MTEREMVMFEIETAELVETFEGVTAATAHKPAILVLHALAAAIAACAIDVAGEERAVEETKLMLEEVKNRALEFAAGKGIVTLKRDPPPPKQKH